MTHVGKILVLVIMAFSLIFLGISTVVFMTSKNWKDRHRRSRQKKVSERQEQAGRRPGRSSRRPRRTWRTAKVNFDARDQAS